jgi:hypothetical protein
MDSSSNSFTISSLGSISIYSLRTDTHTSMAIEKEKKEDLSQVRQSAE